MKKEFVPFEIAKKLRAIGFDESCCAFYEEERVVNKPEMVDDRDQYRVTGWRTCKNSEVPEHYFAAATFSQAFRWFREKHNIYAIIIPTITMHWTFKTMTVVEDMVEVPPYNHVDANDYNTHQEAELACLEKLIEIVENKSTQNTNDGRTMEKLIESNRKFDEKNNDNVKYDSSDRNEDMPNITNFFI